MTTRPGRRNRHTDAYKIKCAMAKARDRANEGLEWREYINIARGPYPEGMPATRWLHPSLYPMPMDDAAMDAHRWNLGLGSVPEEIKRAVKRADRRRARRANTERKAEQ